MKKKIELLGQNIEYSLKQSRQSRSLRLIVHSDGRFVVTAPKWVSGKIIEKFLLEKSKWILDRLEKSKSFVGQISKKNSKKDYEKYKEDARTLALERLNYFNKTYNFKFKRISIRNQKTRWGSCSRKGNLNFNFNIALLPVPLSDYIIVHELCHIGEFNHSQKFWNLVAKTIPNYMDLSRELKGKKLY